jgi:predicted O-methyltransferase YrrM
MLTDEFNHLVDPIRRYLEVYPERESDLQRRIRGEAEADGKEHWIVPAEVGGFLRLLARVARAQCVYEMGSYLGYSATWFVEGLCQSGRVILTESDQSRYARSAILLEAHPHRSRLELRHCDAHTDLLQDQSRYDIILIDHDKPRYGDAYRLAKSRLSPQGLIVADNVLWRRRIVDEAWQNDPSTRGILEFNQLALKDPEMNAVIIPIGDGLLLTTRRGATP